MSIEKLRACIIGLCTLAAAASAQDNGKDADNSRFEATGFAEALLECRAYEGEYMHPFGVSLRRHIHGLESGACHVDEEVLGGMLMTCRYSPDQLPLMADYYAQPAKYEDLVMKSKTTFVDGNPVTKTIYERDGVEVLHPLNEALESGTCRVLSGESAEESG